MNYLLVSFFSFKEVGKARFKQSWLVDSKSMSLLEISIN